MEEYHMTIYPHKQTPFPHQADEFNYSKDMPSRALFWEQGTGKTKPIIDTAAYLFIGGKINTLVVIAPNGVHRNWITDELPAHLPDCLEKDVLPIYWESSKATTQAFKRKIQAAHAHKGLLILTFSYAGYMTKFARSTLWRIFQQRKVLLTLDEGHNIRKPGAKRTVSLQAAGHYPAYKRLLTGTPTDTGPFDMYSQCKFLQANIWRQLDVDAFAAFKQHFGVWLTAEQVKKTEGYDPGFDQLLSYKNIEQLEGIIKTIGSRITKETANLNLPPKLYQKRYFEMSVAQEKAYGELKEEFLTELYSGETITAELAIVRLLRLQQVTCNYLPSDIEDDDKGTAKLVPVSQDSNPRLDCLLELLEETTGPAIIWARFTKDIDLIMSELNDPTVNKYRAVRYDGRLNDDQRAESKRRFQAGEAQFFVANPAVGATGLTLTQAKTVIYYNNNFKLIDRQQSEDRAHRIGQHNAVTYIDIMCPGTVDEHIVKALRKKFNIAAQILGDDLKEWI
jgi:SNF2 family DNA or RNA helicase